MVKSNAIVAVCALLARPYLSIDNTNSADAVEIRVSNHGAGPALVRSAHLQFDGKPVSGWGDLLKIAVGAAHDKRMPTRMQTASVDGTTTVRAGDMRVLFLVRSRNTRVISALHEHRISLAFCYCSINGSCWKNHETANATVSALPQRVSRCDIGPMIGRVRRRFIKFGVIGGSRERARNCIFRACRRSLRACRERCDNTRAQVGTHP